MKLPKWSFVITGTAFLAAPFLFRRLPEDKRRSLRHGLKSLLPRLVQDAAAAARLTWLARSEGYQNSGRQYLGYFIELGCLQPTDQVLDVGCGFARIGHGLTDYLKGGGSYDGLDILPGEIHWCQQHISRRYPHFRFQVADIYNQHYNLTGTQPASQYRFPYADASFDFVFLISVFSHMLPDDLDHYLSEIARVLRPGGRCFITYYLLNPDSYSRGAMDHFPYECNGYRTHDAQDDTWALAYEEEAIRGLYTRHLLKIEEPIRYGTWCGRETHYSLQDVIIASKVEQ